jgi:hypothetical protein
MYNDSIVEEMRENGQAFIAQYNNNLADACKVLKSREQTLGRVVINRSKNVNSDSDKKYAKP